MRGQFLSCLADSRTLELSTGISLTPKMPDIEEKFGEAVKKTWEETAGAMTNLDRVLKSRHPFADVKAVVFSSSHVGM